MAEGPYEMIRKSDGGFHLAAAKPPSSVTDTEKLRAQIEATRAEMSHTIDEIQARLSPSHLMTQAKAAVREAVTRRAKAPGPTGTDGYRGPRGAVRRRTGKVGAHGKGQSGARCCCGCGNDVAARASAEGPPTRND
jgi:Protein of unknown function (DUF3618)